MPLPIEAARLLCHEALHIVLKTITSDNDPHARTFVAWPSVPDKIVKPLRFTLRDNRDGTEIRIRATGRSRPDLEEVARYIARVGHGTIQ